MIKITKELLTELYAECENQEVNVNGENISANSILMKTEYEDGDELTINVYSHYINHNTKDALISNGETNANTIFEKSSFTDETYTIESDDTYAIEDDAKKYLNDLHKKFNDDMKDNDILLIEQKIEQHQEEKINISNIPQKKKLKMRL